MIESELFGYEKGAFTGATAMKRGKFELANGGTLFLDEVGDMSLATQAKLLRVLETRRVDRLGGSTPLEVDVRIVSATNKDLAAEITQQMFREDLYYRLRVVLLRLPPLREHSEDIPLLVEQFRQMLGEKHGRPSMAITKDAVKLLMAADWKGNVRELKNVLEGAMVMSRSDTLGPEDFSADLAGAGANRQGSSSDRTFLPSMISGRRGGSLRLPLLKANSANREGTLRGLQRPSGCTARACKKNCGNWEFKLNGSNVPLGRNNENYCLGSLPHLG